MPNKMDMHDVAKLLRIRKQANKIGLTVLGRNLTWALSAFAQRKMPLFQRHLEACVGLCDLAKGSEAAREFSPGARAILSRMLKKVFDTEA